MDEQQPTINDVGIEIGDNQSPSRLLMDDPLTIENGQVSRRTRTWRELIFCIMTWIATISTIIIFFRILKDIGKDNELANLSTQTQCKIEWVDNITGKCGDNGPCTFSYVRVSVNWTRVTGLPNPPNETYYNGVATTPIECGYSTSSHCPTVNEFISCRVVEDSTDGPNPAIYFDKFKSSKKEIIFSLVIWSIIIIVVFSMSAGVTCIYCEK